MNREYVNTFIRASLWEIFKGLFSGVVAILVFLAFLKHTQKIPKRTSEHAAPETCQEQLP